MAGWVKGLLVGLLVGILGALLLPKLWEGEESVPQKLADALGCPSPRRHSAADALRGPGYSEFAAGHATEILGIGGSETGPAKMYLEFPEPIEMSHVVATLHDFGAVCVVGQGVFEGKVLNGRSQLEELCTKVGGKLEVIGNKAESPREGGA